MKIVKKKYKSNVALKELLHIEQCINQIEANQLKNMPMHSGLKTFPYRKKIYKNSITRKHIRDVQMLNNEFSKLSTQELRILVPIFEESIDSHNMLLSTLTIFYTFAILAITIYFTPLLEYVKSAIYPNNAYSVSKFALLILSLGIFAVYSLSHYGMTALNSRCKVEVCKLILAERENFPIKKTSI